MIPIGDADRRLLRHQDELFQVELVPGLPADNNLAERSLRPFVLGFLHLRFSSPPKGIKLMNPYPQSDQRRPSLQVIPTPFRGGGPERSSRRYS